MVGAMVSASTGALNSLLGKLTTLIGKEYGKLKGVRKEVESLEDEFSSMKALLEKLAGMDELDPQAREWRNQVNDMSYDIEDCIDEFIHHLGNNDAAAAGFVKKTARVLKKLRARRQIASKIQDIKIRVKEVSERRSRYRLDEHTAHSCYLPVDPRVVAIYNEVAGLVGIDVPRDELVHLLMGEEKELKVASIVGFGGLGKTTLASQVYNKLEGKFECRAFVSVSQKPDIAKILNKILSEIGGGSCHTCDLDDLLKTITQHLRDKRYFIVLDDLWDSSAWKVIKCALPANDCGSRVLTTTRIYSTASACSYNQHYVYNMRPLGEDDSRKLFFLRIFGSGEACPDVLEELSADILQSCGGLPLAIISIGSLLAGQPKMVWEYVHNSLGSMFKGNPSLEDMKQILILSYRNLPCHLKTCLLYLGMYPEDSIIKKNDLVRQWIDEGFVSSIHGLDAEDVAGSYFNELINKSLIQPVNTDYNDEVLSCKVHDVMLDLIRAKCEEENFIAVLDDPQAATKPHKKIHRASIHYNNVVGHDVIVTKINKSLHQVRSVVAFTRVLLPSFQELKYVRVLLLEFKAAQVHKMDITSVCGLFLLRYLKIVTDCDLELPNKFWGLRYLDTVVLEIPMRLFVPSGVVRLSRLLHLIVPCGMVFQDGIGSLKSLRTLQAFDFSRSSLESFRSLVELTNLRDLRLDYERFDMDEETMDAFHSLLESLSCCSSLKSIVISSLVPHFDWLSTLSGFPCQIQRLHLWGLWFPRVPKWVSHLHDLYSLELVVIEVAPKDDCIDILAGLPSLVHLRLEIKHDREEMIVIPGTGVTFPALKHLALVCPKPALAFEAGAMPRLLNVDLWLTVSGWGDIIRWLGPGGIKHLPSGLKKFFLCCRGKDADEATLSALRSVFKTHHPGMDLILR